METNPFATEAIVCYSVRQADTDTFRYWEAAGTSHLSAQLWKAFEVKINRDGVRELAVLEGINRIALGPLFDAAFSHMQRWLADATPPPSQPKVEIGGDPAEVVRDEHGIARGGVRLPQVEAPLAQNSAISMTNDILAYLGGSSHAFPREKVHALYGNRANFLAKFEAAAQRGVDSGVLLPRDVAALVSEADAAWPE